MTDPRTIHKPKVYTVAEVIEWLKLFPQDAIVWGYEGEISGIVVGNADFEVYIQTEVKF